MAWDGTLEVSATIANTGTRAAEEVVQSTSTTASGSITRPVRELKAFRKIALAGRARR
ncbi:hypothetical protein AB5I41_23985 [Sphingomonas sp. MMS24-JH45]